MGSLKEFTKTGPIQNYLTWPFQRKFKGETWEKICKL